LNGHNEGITDRALIKQPRSRPVKMAEDDVALTTPISMRFYYSPVTQLAKNINNWSTPQLWRVK